MKTLHTESQDAVTSNMHSLPSFGHLSEEASPREREIESDRERGRVQFIGQLIRNLTMHRLRNDAVPDCLFDGKAIVF